MIAPAPASGAAVTAGSRPPAVAALSLTSRDMLAGLPLSYRQLDYWCKGGLFGEHNAALGSGRRRCFDSRDRAALVICSRMAEFLGQLSGPMRGGITVKMMRAVISTVRANPDERFFSVLPGPVVEPGAVGLAAGCALVFDVAAMEGAA